MIPVFDRPELPEGYFYRVDPYGFVPTVEVRRDRRFGSEEISAALIEGDKTPENISEAARLAALKARAAIRARQTVLAIREYAGDYR